MGKKRILFTIIAFILVLSITTACHPISCKAESTQTVDENGEICKKPQINILLVGNSLTKSGTHSRGRTVQCHLKEMALASGENVHVQTIAYGGAALKSYAGMVDARKKRAAKFNKVLKARRWDYIILQEKTKFHYVKSEELSLPAFEILLEKIEEEAPQAQVLLYLPRGYDSYGGKQITSEEALWMEAHIGAAGLRMEEEFGIDTIPVGMHLYRCGLLYPDINLLGADKNHPTRAGYFLAAGCIYQKIFQTKPEISESMLKQAGITAKEAEQMIGLWGEGISSKTVQILLRKGETGVMELMVPAHIADAKVRFSSMDEKVAVVDSVSGKVTAVASGMTVIMAETIEGWQTYCTVYVPYETPSDVRIETKTDVNENGETMNSVVLRWKKQTGATVKVYRSKSKKGPYKFLGQTKRRKYVDTAVHSGQTWYYKVTSGNDYSLCESKKSEAIRVDMP